MTFRGWGAGALGAVILLGRLDLTAFLSGMPDYFGIVAVLLVLSIAGYPIQAARYEAQIRALVAALTRRGVGFKATAGGLGHVLGAVLDVGARLGRLPRASDPAAVVGTPTAES